MVYRCEELSNSYNKFNETKVSTYISNNNCLKNAILNNNWFVFKICI